MSSLTGLTHDKLPSQPRRGDPILAMIVELGGSLAGKLSSRLSSKHSSMCFSERSGSTILDRNACKRRAIGDKRR
jgi:hypothetical protein